MKIPAPLSAAWWKFLGLSLLLAPSLALAQSVYFVIDNQTGFSNDSVYVTLQGAGTVAAFTGSNATFSGNTSYSLDQLLGNLPSGTLTNVPIISASTIDGGFFSITVGQSIGASAAPNNIINGRFETVVQTGAAGTGPGGASSFYNTNMDVSYVTGLSMPMSFSVKNRSDNSLVSLVSQLNPVTTNSTIWNAVGVAPNIPSAALVAAASNYQVKSSSGQMGTVTGNVSLLSSQAPGGGTLYHDWSTDSGGHTSLLNTLQSANGGAGANLNVSSYTVPTGDAMGGISWTFSGATSSGSPGVSPYSPFNNGTITADSTNRFLTAQSYTTTANFNSNLNPNGSDTTLASYGIVNNTAGVHISGVGGNADGSGNSVGNVDIYITNANLNAANGIYGANPQYVVKWTTFNGSTQTGGTTYYTQQQNSNNLLDRVVGDVAAAITFGWAGSSTTISAQALATGTESVLANSIFSNTYAGAGTGVSLFGINGISTSQYFYLLSLLGVNGIPTGQSGAFIGAWSGSGIDPGNPLFYDSYGNAIVAQTDNYTYAYSDRLQQYSPDIFPLPATGSPADANNIYIDLTLLPGGYTYTVPEPSSMGMLGLGAGALFLIRRRFRKEA